VLSTIGAYMMGLGLTIVLFNWIHSLKFGRKAPANPWGANTLEWHTPSPPPHDNFAVQPVVSDPYDMDDWKYDPSIGGYVNIPDPNRKRSVVH
jgi:cytochrome c oxidase subunit 1